MEVATNGSLDDLFERTMERLTRPFLFMNAFTRWPKTSPRLVRPVVIFIRKNIKHQVEIAEYIEE